MNELKIMNELRIAQVGLRKNLQKYEDNNKAVRAKITPLWDDKTKDEEVTELSKELTRGRSLVRAMQIALREIKHNIRTYNKVYDRKQKKLANTES
jgi:hypothetical protein